jgi:uncharacterized protein YcfJ
MRVVPRQAQGLEKLRGRRASSRLRQTVAAAEQAGQPKRVFRVNLLQCRQSTRGVECALREQVMVKLWVSALALAMLAAGVHAQSAPYPNDDGNAHYGWADVLRADPVHGVTRTSVPRQECYDQQVVRHEGGNGTAGTVLGAVIGGVLGNTVGKGDGRKAATVAGAVAGGAIGNRSARGRDYETTQTQCREVNTISEQRRIIGYDVEYRYRGEVYMSRLDYDPGERLRVRVSVTPVD